jgi:hypothetical protein
MIVRLVNGASIRTFDGRIGWRHRSRHARVPGIAG